MLGNCEKTVINPSTTASNKWTQTQIDDHKVSMMASSGRVMEKPGQELLQQQQQALRCPRCDSSNTKFCYYNNYSLSQPRHFCKACKRYWTRGGTLRNVPVGGGCRKNKRVKRPTSSNIDTTTTASPSPSSTPSANSNPPSQPHIDINASSTSNHINPLLYGLPGNNSCDVMNLQFPRFNSSRVSYDLLHPQLSALGLGFSSGILSSEVNNDDGYRNGFSSNNNNTLLSSYNSIFGSSTTSASMPSTPVMASLLSSTLLQQKFMTKGDPFHGMATLEELKMEGNSGEAGMVASKEVKVEGQNRLEWNNINNGVACQNQMEHMGLGLSDPSLYWNNNNTATALGAWSDQPNIGPSVTSLI